MTMGEVESSQIHSSRNYFVHNRCVIRSRKFEFPAEVEPKCVEGSIHLLIVGPSYLTHLLWDLDREIEVAKVKYRCHME